MGGAMERRIAETVLDGLADEDYNWLHGIALGTTERLVSLLAESTVLDPTDSDPKPGDLDDEPEHRVAALRRVKAAQVAGALLAEVVGDVTSGEAATAVWLGASLADLGSASGSTRQAARKRWPDLGQIYRMRRWLYGHREDILHVAGLLIDAREYTWPHKHVTPAMITKAYDGLIGALVEVRADFAAGSAMSGKGANNQPIVRWQRLGVLVNQHIRNVVEAVTPTNDEADYALSGAVGLLAHYDAVTTAPPQ
ncbi:MAG TPA: hypothetical protein VGM75_30960 [Pseudonocardiaceae bacterium]